jgi:hypothetical protein
VTEAPPKAQCGDEAADILFFRHSSALQGEAPTSDEGAPIAFLREVEVGPESWAVIASITAKLNDSAVHLLARFPGPHRLGQDQ